MKMALNSMNQTKRNRVMDLFSKVMTRFFIYMLPLNYAILGDSLNEHNSHSPSPFFLSVIIHFFLYHKFLYTYYPSCSLSDLCLYDTGENFIQVVKRVFNPIVYI